MAANSGFFLASTDSQVPPVDPMDLKRVWVMQDRVLATIPGLSQEGQQGVISVSLYERACSAGADVRAVFLRVSFLRVLQMLNGKHGWSLPWLHDGPPDDAVSRVLAAIPMSNLPPGGRAGLPFDVEELGRRIEKESETK
jgi:hypothetical protein